jgi:hypothetical protein
MIIGPVCWKLGQESLKKKFRFENHWFSHYDFILVAINGWIAPEHISNPTKRLTTKCKNLRELKI